MKKYKLLQQLLPLLEAYEAQQGEEEVEVWDFLAWAQGQEGNGFSNAAEPHTQAYHHIPPQGDGPAQITQLLALMYKYLKFYFKKGMENSPLVSLDDFGMLATLWIEGPQRKQILIQKNTLEFTSGMEVIRRLERHALIEAQPDPEDGRAKQVQLTERGRYTLLSILPTMQEIGKIAMARLSVEEQAILLGLLHQLNDFHQPIFHQAKKESIGEIVEQFMDN
jgi:DNA-binding MarR family transcriptional regulator